VPPLIVSSRTSLCKTTGIPVQSVKQTVQGRRRVPQRTVRRGHGTNVVRRSHRTLNAGLLIRVGDALWDVSTPVTQLWHWGRHLSGEEGCTALGSL
jgi:hypothetical protein